MKRPLTPFLLTPALCVLSIAGCVSSHSEKDAAKVSEPHGKDQAGKTIEAAPVKRNPQEAEMRVAVGETHIAESRFDEARGELEFATKLDPENARAHIDLGIANYFKAKDLAEAQAQATIVEGLFNDAASSLTKGLALKPDASNGHYYLGLVRYQQFRFPDADAELRKALASQQNNASTLLQLGEVAFADGRGSDAEAWYRKALVATPAFESAHLTLAAVLAAGGDLAAAEKALRDGLKLLPGSQPLYDDLWNLYARDKRWDDLAAAYARLVEEQPRNARAHWYRGYVLAQKGEDAQAAAAFEKAFSLDSTLSSALVEMAKLEIKSKSFDAATKHLRRARQIERAAGADIDESLALEQFSRLAFQLFGSGQMDRAISLTTELAESESNVWYFWSNLGLFYRDSGHYPESFDAYLKAAALQPNDAQLQNDTGLVLDYHLDRPKDALPYYTRAIELANHNETYGNLVRRYVLWKDWDKALEIGEEGLELYPNYDFIRQWVEIAKQGKAGKPVDDIIDVAGGSGGGALRGAPSIDAVAKELKLDGKKKEAVGALLKSHDEQLLAAYQAEQASGDSTGFRQKVDDLRKDLETKLEAVLTPGELKTYREMFPPPRRGGGRSSRPSNSDK